MRLEYASIYAGLNLIILIVVAFLVVRLRQRHKISLGDGGNEALTRAIRAHGNAAEYIPAGLVGLTLLALSDSAVLPFWYIHAAGLSLTAGRILHPVGIHAGVLMWRALGMQLTLLAYVLMAGGLLYAGIVPRL